MKKYVLYHTTNCCLYASLLIETLKAIPVKVKQNKIQQIINTPSGI